MRGLKCKVKYRNGEARVINPDGLPSMLYESLKSIAPNQEVALNAWAISTTDDFDAATGLAGTDNPADALAVLGYYNSLISEEETLSPIEMFEVKQFMASNGIRSMTDLKTIMQRIFRSSGYDSPSGFAAIQSGLYSPEEYNEVNVARVSNLLNKIDGQLLRSDIIVEPETVDVQYKDTKSKTIFGTYEKIGQEQIDKEIENLIVDFSNESEYYEKIKQLDYPDFIDRFYSDSEFAKDLISKFSQLSRVPVLELKDGELSQASTGTYSTVKNTFPANPDITGIVADIVFLEEIPEDIWLGSADEIKSVLKEIEYRMSQQGIDIIGISDKSSSRGDILSLLTNLSNLAFERSEQNLIAFTENIDKLRGEPELSPVRLLPERYRNLNIVEMYSDLSNDELFERYGLIRVDDNLYHKVAMDTSKADIYEYIYREVIDGKIKLPNIKLSQRLREPNNKPELLELITNYINSRETGFSAELQEMASLYQVAFNHFPPAKPNYKQVAAGIASIGTDPNYLRGEFTQDFYKYVLEQKLEDSQVYRKVLSKFAFNDRGIVATGPVLNLTDIGYAQEITDYFRIKRDPLLGTNPEIANPNILDELLYSNFPKTVSRYEGQPSIEGRYAVTEPNNSDFIRIGNTTYKKAGQNLNNNVYQQISDPSTLYYTTLKDSPIIDKQQVNTLLNRYNKAVSTQSPQTVDELRENSGKDLYVTARLSGEEIAENISSISDSQIEVLPLYSTEESQEVYNKISDCG